MKYSILTDRGILRETNQDNCMAASPEADACFAVVCDGMGGAKAGDVASEIAVKIIADRIAAAWRKDMSNESVIHLLESAIAAANVTIFDKAAEDPSLEGMGTTVVVAVVIGDRLVVAHAGDSRAYAYTDRLIQLTRDHSLVQDMVDAGVLTQAQAAVHPGKNYITRALGVAEKVEIDFSEFPFAENEKLLLCSDGLTNFVNESKITEILSSDDCGSMAQRLVAAANENGGGDNITAVVLMK